MKGFIIAAAMATITHTAFAASLCGVINGNTIDGTNVCQKGTSTNMGDTIKPDAAYTYGCVTYSGTNTSASAYTMLLNCSWDTEKFACNETTYWNGSKCLGCPSGTKSTTPNKSPDCPILTDCPSGTTYMEYKVKGNGTFRGCVCTDTSMRPKVANSQFYGHGSGGCYPCPAGAILGWQISGYSVRAGNETQLMNAGCFCPPDTFFNGVACEACPNGGHRRTSAIWNDSIDYCGLYSGETYRDETGSFTVSDQPSLPTTTPSGCTCTSGLPAPSRAGETANCDAYYDYPTSCLWSDTPPMCPWNN